MPSPEPVRPAVAESVNVPAETESVTSHVRSNGPASGSRRAMPLPDAAEKDERRLIASQADGLRGQRPGAARRSARPRRYCPAGRWRWP